MQHFALRHQIVAVFTCQDAVPEEDDTEVGDAIQLGRFPVQVRADLCIYICIYI